MSMNKQILKYCTNFYKIMNFDYFEDDFVTETLINVYHDYIFSFNTLDEATTKKLIEIDETIAKYIDDYAFRKEMKNELVQIKIKKDETNILEAIVLNILAIFEKYEAGDTVQLYISRWI